MAQDVLRHHGDALSCPGRLRQGFQGQFGVQLGALLEGVRVRVLRGSLHGVRSTIIFWHGALELLQLSLQTFKNRVLGDCEGVLFLHLREKSLSGGLLVAKEGRHVGLGVLISPRDVFPHVLQLHAAQQALERCEVSVQPPGFSREPRLLRGEVGVQLLGRALFVLGLVALLEVRRVPPRLLVLLQQVVRFLPVPPQSRQRLYSPRTEVLHFL